MKPIDVQQQPRMGVARTFSLTINGIRYRLFRSAVTVGVIAVAIAFMMNVLSEGLVKSAVARKTAERTRHERRASMWAAKLTAPGSIGEVISSVAATEIGDNAYEELRQMGGIAEPPPLDVDSGPLDMESYHVNANLADGYLKFFADLDFATRKRLLPGDQSGTQVFDLLVEKAEFDSFWNVLKKTRAVTFVSTIEEFQAFLAGWERTSETTAMIQKGRIEAVSKINAALDGRRIIVALADAEGEFGRDIVKAGFALSAEEAKTVASQARDIIDAARLEETVSRPEARKAVAAYLDILPVEVNIGVVWDLFASRRKTDYYFKKLEENGVEIPELSGVTDHESRVARTHYLGKKRAQKMAMTYAERESSDSGGGLMGMGERKTWLLFASMIVCVVGVTNAMLMSVTERFREIATLKCLGAMDDFIMLMFVFEAGVLGLAGGVLGAVAGGLIGVSRMFVTFGGYLLPLIPVGQLASAVLISVVMGMALAAFGAVYPSFKAARLAPMEAMRIA